MEESASLKDKYQSEKDKKIYLIISDHVCDEKKIHLLQNKKDFKPISQVAILFPNQNKYGNMLLLLFGVEDRHFFFSQSVRRLEVLPEPWFC